MSRSSSHEPPTRRWLVRGFRGFNLVIGYALLAILVVLAGVALIRLLLGIWSLLLADFADGFGFTEASYGDFQAVFGMIITLLIAMELLHAVVDQFILRHKLSMLLRIFLVITLLALARKLLLIDVATVSAYVLFALAAAVPLIATALWLLGRYQPMGVEEPEE
jgi:hypothetical protein